jgi:hypothetical protein
MDRCALEVHRVVGVDEVRRAGGRRQGGTAGDVVVVNVGLEHVGEPDPVLVEQREDPVDVALRVHHQGDLAVVDQVAAVAQAGCLHDQDGQPVDLHALAHLRRSRARWGA